MAAPSLLLLIQLALPATLQALPHVLKLVNNFLLTLTIDAAIYNVLPCVLYVYGPFRPRTFRAMDGAAARGRLGIIQRLRSYHGDVCSAAAFIGAAANGHLDVLRWLHNVFPSLRRDEEEIVAAAERGHLEICKFLLREVELGTDLAPTLAAAAANGHFELSRWLLQVIGDPSAAFIAAAENGHAAILHILCERYSGDSGRRAPVGEALKRAIAGAHFDAIVFSIRIADETSVGEAFGASVRTMTAEMMKLILEKCEPGETVLACILWAAAHANCCEIVEVVLDKCPSKDMSRTRPPDFAIGKAMKDAAGCGRLDLVKVLLKKGRMFVDSTLLHAVNHDQWEVAKFLLQVCEDRVCQESDLERDLLSALIERAAADDDVEMALQVLKKCREIDTDLACEIAADCNSLNVIKLLAEQSGPACVAGAFVSAASKDQVQMVNALLAYVDGEAIKKALGKAVLSDKVAVSRVLLKHCTPDIYKPIFRKAASIGSSGVLQLLLNRMDSCSISRALITAGERGHVKVVQVLLGKTGDSGISCALEIVALHGDCGLVALLQPRCDLTAVEKCHRESVNSWLR